MPIAKNWDAKKKCYHIPHTAKLAKQFASAVSHLVPVIGPLAKNIAKEIYLARLKKQNFCKEDIEWVKKNI
ncbi:hypothetical protein ES703_69944 [subsurface metagenome]|jgi:hypothetical protein